MDLKKRLRTAFVIMIILPIMMMGISAKFIIESTGTSVQETYDVDADTMQVLTNPLRILNRVTREAYNQIKLCAIREPEKLEDMEYIASMNKELASKYSYLVIRKEDEIVYYGGRDNITAIQSILPEFGDYSTDVDGGLYIGDLKPVLIKHQDFYFSDGSEGSVFIVTEVNVLVPQLKTSIVQVIVCMIIIVIMTAVILVVWLYRTIIRPLDILKAATNEMKYGNLNYSISGDPEDEIGQLCQDFEEMRIHLKELIEERLQYEQDSKELISNISHDLKTPITAVKGYVEGIMDGVADTPEKMDKYIKTIYNKANDMDRLINELTTYSGIDNNRIPYNFHRINVAEYFGDCVEEVGLDLESKNIQLNYEDLVEPSTQIIADPEQLKRVINNIIGNSVKYLDKEQGIIDIRILDEVDSIRVEIEDNGKGIAAKDLPNIFERFYRTDASRNSSQGGSGIGLSIVKKIIEDHGGYIWATSKENEGTCMHFVIRKWLSESEKG